jgi:acyl-CoA synthetase (AMP-forming)/AMP-acid ligase II
MNITDYIRQHAANKPDHPALIEGESTLSYAELVEEYQRWVNVLAAYNLQAGDRLGLGLRDNSEYVIAVLAAAHLGAIVVPVDWRSPPDDQRRIAEKFEVTLLLTDRPGRTISGIRTIPVDAAWRQQVAASTSTCPPCQTDDCTLIIKLSSGTTGTPKGAIVTHSNFIYRMMRNLISHGSLTEMRYLSALPLCFSGGFNYCFINLIFGNTVILYPPLFSAEEIVAAIQRYKINYIFLVPTVLRWLLELPRQQEPLLPELKILITSSASISGEEKLAVVQRISPNLSESYSTSAAGQIAFCKPSLRPDKAHSVGQVNPMMQAEVVDENATPVPAGVTGSLRCRGPGVSTNYYGENTGASAAERLQDGWCYTGDLGEFDTEGFLYIHGRADDVIIRGGVNIYPKVIENHLLDHPDILEVAVVGRACASKGQEVIAFLISGAAASSAELKAYCLQKIPANAVPSEFHFVSEFPRTATGKVRKYELLS